ncbi:MAG: carbon-nitrogen hydrolase family protein, partial [Gammaproteobacteria bacterium]|nr:carbon-nitrogen hydrolase family protein [Gammaproteobacteria bacterium]NIR97845.1 carbon-nitrogen hydrolase family protein [Gammaproteobacteria bacterium]NIT63540.1 carbon-nitrogen hydrolase family protein [Gammaproteobacteria bacterium]NIV20489.1 carbon-nitrogen hydrolase family protein [Gammaproteobacteria bacterium]NIX11085.1 carbon-nitrogen hydrolase family protein [Gammaproteobacteria bacterium]
LYLGRARGKFENATDVDGPVVQQFRDAAARHGILVLLGSIHERIAGREDR